MRSHRSSHAPSPRSRSRLRVSRKDSSRDRRAGAMEAVRRGRGDRREHHRADVRRARCAGRTRDGRRRPDAVRAQSRIDGHTARRRHRPRGQTGDVQAMTDIIMPKMGDAMTEGKVVRWYKKAGEAVKKGEPVLEIETDKVNLDLEAEADGTLGSLSAEEGAVVPVGGVLAKILAEGEKEEPAAKP